MAGETPARKKETPEARKEADEFEKELDEFFEDRAYHRAQHFADPNMKDVAKEREGKEDVSPIDPMSGCCQTSCHDCPWGYSQA